MTNKERLELALEMLRLVSEEWDEDEVLSYPRSLPSFDEVVAGLAAIEFKE